ncbi:MAG: phosphoribosylglycinamide formyltransferase [Armatimonadetes bacterium]|nr:phosphoribosylglycinamide formyltransferase [Armatimonadota bacterium]
MAALIQAGQAGSMPASVVLVVSPRAESVAALRAREMGVHVEVVSPKEPDYAEHLLGALLGAGIDWVCLAGLMSKVPCEVLDAFSGRVLNIHPALLPKYGGQGMWGMHVHEAVLAAGEKESGCTVHVVTEEYDEGPIVLQMRCPVEQDDTPESLAARVLALEHEAFPMALEQLIEARSG